MPRTASAAFTASLVRGEAPGHNIQLKLNATDGSFPLYVQYMDDRFSGAPMVCIKVFYTGAQTADLCDKDSSPRFCRSSCVTLSRDYPASWGTSAGVQEA